MICPSFHTRQATPGTWCCCIWLLIRSSTSSARAPVQENNHQAGYNACFANLHPAKYGRTRGFSSQNEPPLPITRQPWFEKRNTLRCHHFMRLRQDVVAHYPKENINYQRLVTSFPIEKWLYGPAAALWLCTASF